MAGINAYQKPGSPLEGIAHALDIVHSIYGIPQAQAAAEKVRQESALLGQRAAEASAEADPNSPVSKQAQSERAIELGAGKKYGMVGDDQYLQNMKQVMGSPGVPEVRQKQAGPLNQGQSALADIVTPGREAVPGLSAQALKSSADTGLMGLIKGKQAADASAARMAGLTGTKTDANIMRANAAYDSNIGKKYEDRLDAANRVKALISAAKDGSLIPSENLGQQLATDINLLQAGHTSVSGTNHSRPSTLFGKGGQLAHFLSGDPQAAITQADLGQMEKETNLLYNEIGDQHKSKFSSWIQGQPPVARETLLNRFNTARSQYFPQGQEAGGLLPGGPAVKDIGGAQAADVVPHVTADDIAAEMQRRLKAKK